MFKKNILKGKVNFIKSPEKFEELNETKYYDCH